MVKVMNRTVVESDKRIRAKGWLLLSLVCVIFLWCGQKSGYSKDVERNSSATIQVGIKSAVMVLEQDGYLEGYLLELQVRQNTESLNLKDDCNGSDGYLIGNSTITLIWLEDGFSLDPLEVEVKIDPLVNEATLVLSYTGAIPAGSSTCTELLFHKPVILVPTKEYAKKWNAVLKSNPKKVVIPTIK